jgi:DNA (cytosine-5)-methyltransferase 1
MIRVADLFCGAGGASTGFLQAADKRGLSVDLVAVNHWPTAVQTHTMNHPSARHFCQSIETLDPEVAVPSGRLDLLIAAPECVHFSTARGGRPMSDQSRASAWHLLRWLEVLRVDHLLIENVPEFQTWGPLGATGRPLVAKRGSTFRAFIGALESLNYRVEWKVLNAADYGAVTTRRRLFLQARRGNKPIVWPRQTHSKTGGRDLFGGLKKWRAAREVIDWSLKSESIFSRKRPLKPATIRRIIEGLKRFGGPELQPFIVQLTHGTRTSSVDVPFQTITGANRGELGVAEPFMVGMEHGGRVVDANQPLPTITTAKGGSFGVAEPFIVPYHAEREGQSARTHDVNQPLPVVPTSPVFGLAEPFIVPFRSDNDGRKPRVGSVDSPLHTITTENPIGLVEPFILGQQSGSIARQVTEPVPTIAADGAIALAEAFLTKYNRTATGGYSIDDPLDTVSTRDRFALVQPVVDGMALDIRFRMLQPHELSAAMSFPKGYQFSGNKGETIKQVGNAIDVTMARALGFAILDAMHGAPSKKSEAVA